MTPSTQDPTRPRVQ